VANLHFSLTVVFLALALRTEYLLTLVADIYMWTLNENRQHLVLAISSMRVLETLMPKDRLLFVLSADILTTSDA